jgi:adenylylsulfate kinase-like enzyme
MRGETIAAAPVTLAEHVAHYLDAHAVGRDPKTIDVLRFRLGYATRVFGELRLDELERRVAEVAGWMTTLPAAVLRAVRAPCQPVHRGQRRRVGEDVKSEQRVQRPGQHRDQRDPLWGCQN